MSSPLPGEGSISTKMTHTARPAELTNVVRRRCGAATGHADQTQHSGAAFRLDHVNIESATSTETVHSPDAIGYPVCRAPRRNDSLVTSSALLESSHELDRSS